MNPYYKKNSCYITINHRHQSNQSGGSVTRTILSDGHKYRTMEDLRIAVTKELGGFPYGPNVAIHRYVDTNSLQECVGIFYQHNTYGFVENGYLLPRSICAIAPPPIGHCDILADSVDLNYCNLSENELDGAVHSKTVNITCNQDVTLNVIATGMMSREVSLHSDNSTLIYLLMTSLVKKGMSFLLAKAK